MNSQKSKIVKVILSVVTFVIFVSTGFQDKFLGNWSYQEVPQLTNSINDIKFLDSLTGFLSSYTYLYKTTNGGYNWELNYSPNKQIFKIQFLNNQTGYLAAATSIYKTTNQGNNWSEVPKPYTIGVQDIAVLNQDTIWIVFDENLTGGVYRTTNGGTSWQLQWSGGASNPNRIYMFNKDFGFQTSSYNSALLRTTNSGNNWQVVSGTGYYNIKFFDTLTGYRTDALVSGEGKFKKTTDGGLSWTTMQLPTIPSPGSSLIEGFSFVNRDTVWGVGGYKFLGSRFAGVVYNSTNGGNTWRYQIPDTTSNFISYNFVQFINSKVGWIYRLPSKKGFYTTLGGDTAFITTSISNNEFSLLPDDFVLYQNYPNPFNPFTTIKFSLKINSQVSLEVFDIKGGKIKTIIDNKRITSGTYEYGFDGSNQSSGIYFYRLTVNNKSPLTKKMIMIK